ncbi:hypothetical protein Dsin_029846 [Dipteronia sinensis]|uniref:Uncharacterized protein n=1 Tax=Dipteronia sinensis TaxID=43782 RepID=A0AAE0DVR8_9ROSI|nr:hypothetical protein Dsin_029846 [Dipteronia sinensis]
MGASGLNDDLGAHGSYSDLDSRVTVLRQLSRQQKNTSTVSLESRGGSKGRSLTLEEATDAIHFCSSIVQDLAYQVATIAMEKENEEPIM